MCCMCVYIYIYIIYIVVNMYSFYGSMTCLKPDVLINPPDLYVAKVVCITLCNVSAFNLVRGKTHAHMDF